MHGRSKCMSGLVFPISAQQGMISISETKRNHWRGWGWGGGGWNSCNYCGGMSVGFVMQKTDMFKTSGRASFLIIL